MFTFHDPTFVIRDGRKLAYEEIVPPNPKGTILLLPGLAVKRQAWYRQMETFGAQYRTIAIDNRDIGDSDLTPAPYSIADQAEDAVAILDALRIAQAHVIGISMGGFIALELTLRHPERVEKLVLTSTSAGGSTHVAANWRIMAMLTLPRFDRDVGKVAKRSFAMIMAPGYCASHPEEWETIAELARHRPQPTAAYRRQLRACMKHNVAAQLGMIDRPTLVVHGDSDPLIPTANGKYLAEHIPGAQLILYPHTGHIPIIEQAASYNRDVLAFLEQ